MTEHNLQDKDDAPWLDTTYDGFMTDYEAQMLHDFKNRWEVRRKLLNHVKNSLFPEYKSWDQLTPKTLEVINNIVESLVRIS